MAAASLPAVRAALVTESDPGLIARFTMILGLLGRYAGDTSDRSTFVSLTGGDKPLMIRRAAALALGTLCGASSPASAIELLIDATDDDAGLREDAKQMRWRWSQCALKGYYWRVLHAMGF